MQRGTPMYPPAPDTSTFDIWVTLLSRERVRHLVLALVCRTMHLVEHLHDSIALAIGHIIVYRQRDDILRGRFGVRQQRRVGGIIRGHLMARRAVVFENRKVLFL